jgi:hypothetical protein
VRLTSISIDNDIEFDKLDDCAAEVDSAAMNDRANASVSNASALALGAMTISISHCPLLISTCPPSTRTRDESIPRSDALNSDTVDAQTGDSGMNGDEGFGITEMNDAFCAY